MNKNLRYLLIFSILFSVSAKAQFQVLRDSVVQLYGVVMTADSLKGLQSVSVVVKGTGRGTISNDQGVFSIVVLKGDQIEFSSVGYKSKLVNIPQTLEGNSFSVIQLMVTDTIYLPATIIKSRPSRQQFERDFLNTAVPDDKFATAQKNTDENTRRFLVATLPSDGREAASNYLRATAAKTYYAGQTPPMNIFNPFAWSEFIKAWKRGDFKKKNY